MQFSAIPNTRKCFEERLLYLAPVVSVIFRIVFPSLPIIAPIMLLGTTILTGKLLSSSFFLPSEEAFLRGRGQELRVGSGGEGGIRRGEGGFRRGEGGVRS